MTDSRALPKIGFNDMLRFLLELFAFVTLAVWGFTTWPFPWPALLVGVVAPAFAITLWALFRSPRAVFRLDPFGKAIIEIAVFGAAAIAWWDMGLPIIGGVFAVVATVSGVLSGRAELR